MLLLWFVGYGACGLRADRDIGERVSSSAAATWQRWCLWSLMSWLVLVVAVFLVGNVGGIRHRGVSLALASGRC
jgi:hypothetical protein